MHGFMSLMLLMELQVFLPVSKKVLDYNQVKLNVDTKLMIHSFQVHINHN
jgi:hypothetical protein